MGLFTKLFGGSRSKNESGNHAYEQLGNQLGGMIGLGGGASSSIAQMLGLSGTGEQNKAFDNFKNSTGYNFLMDSGVDAITGSRAARGLLRSGASGKAITNYAQNLASTTYGDYMDRLLGLGNQSIAAAGVLSDAGRYSKGKSSSDTGGFGKFIGAVLSEPSQKTNVTKLGELEDGLGIYAFEYKKDPGTLHIGTMADEVEELRPWALGPTTDEGHRTVYYHKLGDA